MSAGHDSMLLSDYSTPPDSPLGPSIQMCAALPRIVVGHINEFKFLVKLLKKLNLKKNKKSESTQQPWQPWVETR